MLSETTLRTVKCALIITVHTLRSTLAQQHIISVRRVRLLPLAQKVSVRPQPTENRPTHFPCTYCRLSCFFRVVDPTGCDDVRRLALRAVCRQSAQTPLTESSAAYRASPESWLPAHLHDPSLREYESLKREPPHGPRLAFDRPHPETKQTHQDRSEPGWS